MACVVARGVNVDRSTIGAYHKAVPLVALEITWSGIGIRALDTSVLLGAFLDFLILPSRRRQRRRRGKL